MNYGKDLESEFIKNYYGKKSMKNIIGFTVVFVATCALSFALVLIFKAC